MSEDRPGSQKEIAVIVGEPGPDGSLQVLRIGEKGVSVDVIAPVADGSNVDGKEILSLGRRNGIGYEVEVLYDGRPAASGPAMVNSRAYRSGWDSVFGSRPGRDASLN